MSALAGQKREAPGGGGGGGGGGDGMQARDEAAVLQTELDGVKADAEEAKRRLAKAEEEGKKALILSYNENITSYNNRATALDNRLAELLRHAPKRARPELPHERLLGPGWTRSAQDDAFAQALLHGAFEDVADEAHRAAGVKLLRIGASWPVVRKSDGGGGGGGGGAAAVPHVLVMRPQAFEVWNTVWAFRNDCRVVVVKGSPGIGKSRGLTYLLRMALRDGRAAVYEARNTGTVFVFLPPGSVGGNDRYEVYRHTPLQNYFLAGNCALLRDSGLVVGGGRALHLVDPSNVPAQRRGVGSSAAFAVLAASPSRAHYKEHEGNDVALCLGSWSLPELLAAKAAMQDADGGAAPLPGEEVARRASVVGRLPRYVFSTVSMEDRAEKMPTKVTDLRQAGRLETILHGEVAHISDDFASSHLFGLVRRKAYEPGEPFSENEVSSFAYLRWLQPLLGHQAVPDYAPFDVDGAVPEGVALAVAMLRHAKTNFELDFVSEHALDLIVKGHAAEIETSLRRVGRYGGTLMGHVFERVALGVLAANPAVRVRDLATGRERKSVKLFGRARELALRCVDGLGAAWAEAKSDELLVPARSNEAVIDSATAGRCGQQMTIAEAHPMSGRGCKKLLEALAASGGGRGRWTAQSFSVYFVVPWYRYEQGYGGAQQVKGQGLSEDERAAVQRQVRQFAVRVDEKMLQESVRQLCA